MAIRGMMRLVPSLGLCHQWEMVMTQGMIQCSEWRVAPRAEL